MRLLVSLWLIVLCCICSIKVCTGCMVQLHISFTSSIQMSEAFQAIRCTANQLHGS